MNKKEFIKDLQITWLLPSKISVLKMYFVLLRGGLLDWEIMLQILLHYSPFSSPKIPTWLGTQQKCIFIPVSWRSLMLNNILIAIGWFRLWQWLSVFKVLMLSVYKLKIWNASRFYVSSLRRGHAYLHCIVPILVYVLPKRVRRGIRESGI